MSVLSTDSFKPWLSQAILEAGGLTACVIPLDNPEFREAVKEQGEINKKWLEQGFGADMSYLYRFAELKAEPWNLFPKMKSMIVFTFTNDWGEPEAEHPFPLVADDALTGYISAYAKEQDYHRTGHQVMLKLLPQLEELLGTKINYETAVDTKPIFERFHAAWGGLGEIGPNDLLRTRERDVRVFIGTLFVDQELPLIKHEVKMRFPCHHCSNCETACPTGAITPGEEFDSNKCISYLSIEKKGILNKEEKVMLEDWLFGCDWCTVVCPPKDKIDTRIPVDLDWLLKSSAGQIKRLIKGSAIEYAGVVQLRRNAIAILQEKYPDNQRAQELIQWTKENSNSQLILDQIETGS